MIKKQDALLFLKNQPDCSVDILYCDPPYALGSEITIRSDGKPDYAKAVDFMNKWEVPDGKFWEEFYKETFRVLKFGGHCLMFGMDRQNFMFKYYGHLAGFQEKQSLYWYFISNFPKASDLSKMIDKNAGAKREIVGKNQYASRRPKKEYEHEQDWGNTLGGSDTANITTPSTPLAKKYSGYRYSISPLKQVVEEIMVFQKPYTTGSCLYDTLAMENGDESITCGALDIDGNRVATIESDNFGKPNNDYGDKTGGHWHQGKQIRSVPPEDGRFPSQAFCDSGTAEILDGQSRLKCGQQGAVLGTEPSFNKDIRLYGDWSGQGKTSKPRNDIGGCSKILHKCDYDEHDLFFYCPKVSKSERNAGCDALTSGSPCKCENPEWEIVSTERIFFNNHPTLKPISLNYQILKLFKTPNKQRILVPFCGSGSEIIGAIKAGYEDIEGCEINDDYIKIAEARIDYWSTQFNKK